MKAVLMSIKPEWCELIASGKKTFELRKSFPRLENLSVPFKVYIYETQSYSAVPQVYEDGTMIFKGRGKVIGEFVCKEIDRISKRGINNNFDYCYLSLNEFGNDDIEVEIRDIKKSCISKKELNSYGANSPELFAWHISDLVIYDQPKELAEFHAPCDSKCDGMCYEGVGCCRVITRPPQSWCYVEELE